MSVAVRFVAENAVTTTIIQRFTHGWPSHCEMFWDERDGGTYLGAQPDGGVQIRPANYLTPVRIEHVTIPLSFAQESAMRDFLKAQIGKPYDLLAVASFAFGANWRTPGHWFCSDLIDAPLESMGVLRARVPQNRVSPAQLLADLQATPGVVCSS